MPRNADYTYMRCRYCGKELALLKRLRGGGEFCSEAHKQSYQDEYNRLALSRLLQAQKQQANLPGRRLRPLRLRRWLLKSRIAEEADAEARVVEAHADRSPVMEPKPLEVSALQEPLAQEEVAAEAAAAVEPEALEIAEFLVDRPGIAELEAEAPYLEPWIELSSGPAVIDVQSPNQSFALSTAALLSLDFQLKASPAEQGSQAEGAQASLTPAEFKNAPGQPSLPWKAPNMHQLPWAGKLSMQVAATVADFTTEAGGVKGVNFEAVFLIQDSHLLDLPFTGVVFPAENSEVQLDLQQQDLTTSRGARHGIGGGERRQQSACIARSPIEIASGPGSRRVDRASGRGTNGAAGGS